MVLLSIERPSSPFIKRDGAGFAFPLMSVIFHMQYVQRQIESSPEIKVLLPEGTQPVFGLLSTSYTKNASTHSLDYRFLFKEHSRSTMTSLELVIKNVQTDSQEEYGSFSACSKMDVLR